MDHKLSCTIVLVGALSLWSIYAAAEQGDEIVVIVNKANTVQALSRDELRPIFQTRKTAWPDGSRIQPFDLPEDNLVRNGFTVAVLGLDDERLARYWVDRKIRGGERPPPKLPSAALVVSMVASSKGAIGYVNVSDANATVKIVARLRGGQVTAP
jgi:ABC-type phosphate transport system substrate-binding protein